MIMLRGLPLSYSPDELQTVYWGIGTHLGTAVSQNKDGELFGVVKDFGQMENTKRRGSKTADGLEFHSDRCDVVGLLCVRKAKSGGASRIVSSAAIHNEVLRRRPDLMDVFYDPELCHSWHEEAVLERARPGRPPQRRSPAPLDPPGRDFVRRERDERRIEVLTLRGGDDLETLERAVASQVRDLDSARVADAAGSCS